MMVPALLLVLIAIVVVLVAMPSARTGSPGSATPSASGARRILDQRLAAGELTPQEHARRVAVLTEARPDGSRRATAAAVIGGVAILGLLVAALAWGWTGWDWSEHDRQMGSHMGWRSADGSASAPVPGAPTFEVTATDLQFDPTTLTITAGVPVNLTLVNDGKAFHDLTIPSLDFMLDAEPGERTTGSLTVDAPGTYEWVCSVPGHAQAGMRGNLTVRPAEAS